MLQKLKAKLAFAIRRKEVFRANKDVLSMKEYEREIELIEKEIADLEKVNEQIVSTSDVQVKSKKEVK